MTKRRIMLDSAVQCSCTQYKLIQTDLRIVRPIPTIYRKLQNWPQVRINEQALPTPMFQLQPLMTAVLWVMPCWSSPAQPNGLSLTWFLQTHILLGKCFIWQGPIFHSCSQLMSTSVCVCVCAPIAVSTSWSKNIL